jgi:endoribonuclease Dicer
VLVSPRATTRLNALLQVIREFAPSPKIYSEYPIPYIWTRFDCSEIPETIEIPWQQLNTRYLFTLESLGVFAAELFLYSDLRMRISELSRPRDVNEMESLRKRYLNAEIIGDGRNPLSRQIPELHDLCEILAEYQPFFEHGTDAQDTSDPWAFRLSWCSPKVQTLVDILLESYSPEFHGIVFVERRHIARVLSSIISRVPTLKNIITCAECVGHGGEEKGIGGGMPTEKQRKIVNDFRDGKINLRKWIFPIDSETFHLSCVTVIATPVAEEGLDFPVSPYCTSVWRKVIK